MTAPLILAMSEKLCTALEDNSARKGMYRIDVLQMKQPSCEKLSIRMDRLLIETPDGQLITAANELGGLLRGIS